MGCTYARISHCCATYSPIPGRAAGRPEKGAQTCTDRFCASSSVAFFFSAVGAVGGGRPEKGSNLYRQISDKPLGVHKSNSAATYSPKAS
eukprot:3067479-Pyramimonas_sp.AAC.1